jgi:protein gp37
MSQSTVGERPECTWSPTDGACGRCGNGNCRTGKVSARNGSPKNGSKKSRNADCGVVVRPQARLNEKALAQLKQWPEPRKAIVSGDLFCDCVPIALIRRVFTSMGEASQHVFRIVTSNSTRLMLLDPHLRWWPNIEVGVKVECKDDTYRIYQLRNSSAHVKFVSFELRESMGKLDLTGINRVVVSSATSPGAKPLNPDWVREIREQCLAQNVKFVVNGRDGASRMVARETLDNRASDEMPEPLTAQDLELLAAAENNPVEPQPAPLADLSEQTIPARIWAFLRSCPGIAVALIALMALLMLAEGLWIKPVPLTSLLKDTAVMVIMATFFTLVIHYITQDRWSVSAITRSARVTQPFASRNRYVTLMVRQHPKMKCQETGHEQDTQTQDPGRTHRPG